MQVVDSKQSWHSEGQLGFEYNPVIVSSLNDVLAGLQTLPTRTAPGLHSLQSVFMGPLQARQDMSQGEHPMSLCR